MVAVWWKPKKKKLQNHANDADACRRRMISEWFKPRLDALWPPPSTAEKDFGKKCALSARFRLFRHVKNIRDSVSSVSHRARACVYKFIRAHYTQHASSSSANKDHLSHCEIQMASIEIILLWVQFSKFLSFSFFRGKIIPDPLPPGSEFVVFQTSSSSLHSTCRATWKLILCLEKKTQIAF